MMAFLKFGKKRKDDPLDVPMPSFDIPTQPAQQAQVPVNQVMSMKQQGLNNNQILQALQNQGYTTAQIYDALNQTSIPQDNEQVEMGMPDYGQSYQQQAYQEPPLQSFQTPGEQQSLLSISEERVQEVAEAIIDEKWQEFEKDVKKVIDWKEKNEERLSKIEQQIADLRISMDSLIKSIMSKISSYDQNIIDVGVEVKAMEKVFQKVLPNLTESVNKLDRMTKGYKEPTQPQKK